MRLRLTDSFAVQSKDIHAIQVLVFNISFYFKLPVANLVFHLHLLELEICLNSKD